MLTLIQSAPRRQEEVLRLDQGRRFLLRGLQRGFGERVVEIVAAECRIAAGRQDLEHALLQTQQRDVKRAAAEIVDRNL